MREWIRAFRIWRSRRRRFAEEWAFHLEMAAGELESLGMHPVEAQRQARRRLGARRLHRRAAMRELEADARGLRDLLPIRSVRRGAFLAPLLIAASVAVMLALNPARVQVVESLYRLLPSTRADDVPTLMPLTAGAVPTGFASLALWLFVLVGVGRVALGFSARGNWRAGAYAVAVLCELAMAGGVCWATGLQLLLGWRWGSDLLQGVALGSFAFAFSWSAWFAQRLWWRDVERRCPVCLRLPGMPEVRGKRCDVLLEPLEVEAICLRGHGLAIESRWQRGFARQ